MAVPLLFDSDVLIDCLRNHTAAVAYLEEVSEQSLISAVTVAELFAGVRDEAEKEILTQFVHLFEVVPVDSEIAKLAGIYRRDYRASHGTGLMDALIAATAKLKHAQLVTLNKRHFPMLTNVHVPYKKS